jgi:hypothetical protein
MMQGCGMRRVVFYEQMPLGIFVHKIPKPKNAELMMQKDKMLTAHKNLMLRIWVIDI